MHRFCILLTLVLLPRLCAADRPNILWLSCEDISPHIGCYGDPHAITPHLDALAKAGLRYTHAFTTAGVCAPCRSGIITGMYQNSIGTHHMRCNAQLPEFVKPFPMYLRKAGYYCTNASKTDYQFKKPGKNVIWDESSGKAHWKKREKGQPFFAVFNFGGCHESGIASTSKYRSVTKVLSASQRQNAEDLTTLPPYYPDTPVAREDWKRNYELITAMDAWVGGHIKALKDAGLYDDTIIMFWSDHGVGLPRAKRWLYDSGTHIPLVVRIPEKYRSASKHGPGTQVSELVSSVDFAPTVLNLAGVSLPEHFQGRAFLGKDLTPQRKYVFGARDRMDERYDIIRSVRGPRYRYIRNFEPLKPYYQYMNTPEKGATMREIRKAVKNGKGSDAMRLFTGSRKPVEEFYDLQNDPHELNNLAEQPEYQARMREMRQVCAEWQFRIRDLGLMPESEIELREKDAGSRFQILRGDDAAAQLGQLILIATKASEGPKAVDDLTRAIESSEASIRYWAATGLGNIGKLAEKSAARLRKAIRQDKSPAVRIAAARALCRMGQLEVGLPVLGNELSGSQQWARLQAAIALDYLDEAARPILPQLEKALKGQPNKYIVRVANRAVNDLKGTNNVVR